MEKTLTYLGRFTGVSKKNNPFTIAYFYGEPDEKVKPSVDGFIGQQYFIDSDLYPSISALKPLEKVKCDVRFIGGQNVLINVSVIK